jgi:hypothetical protein
MKRKTVNEWFVLLHHLADLDKPKTSITIYCYKKQNSISSQFRMHDSAITLCYIHNKYNSAILMIMPDFPVLNTTIHHLIN